jgi:hypothetical protein
MSNRNKLSCIENTVQAGEIHEALDVGVLLMPKDEDYFD